MVGADTQCAGELLIWLLAAVGGVAVLWQRGRMAPCHAVAVAVAVAARASKPQDLWALVRWTGGNYLSQPSSLWLVCGSLGL